MMEGTTVMMGTIIMDIAIITVMGMAITNR